MLGFVLKKKIGGIGLILPDAKQSIFGERFLWVCGCIYLCVAHEDIARCVRSCDVLS